MFMFNDLTTPLTLFHSRRSGKARDMIAPGPDADQMAAILNAATRVPDHGKLNPWRFIVIGADQRDALSTLLTGAYRTEKPAAGRLEIEAMDAMARQAPALVIALFSPRMESHIPLWEQQLSMGAACMQMMNAAHAQGFVANWLTGWPSQSDTVRNHFGAEHERIAGFFYFGTPAKTLEERPRPDFDAVVTYWDGAL
jgi:nitroreductase